MSDPKRAAAELRSLEEKRLASGLTPDEEARRTALASSVVAPTPPRVTGFDVTAAAAQVRAAVVTRPAAGGTEPTAAWDLGTAAAALPEMPKPTGPEAALEPEAEPILELEPEPQAEPVEPESILELEPEPSLIEPQPIPEPEAEPDPALGSPVDLSDLVSSTSTAEAAAPPHPATPQPDATRSVVARLTPVPHAPPAPAPAAAPPPAALRPEVVAGAWRVVLHTAEGLVRRGVVTDFDPDASDLRFAAQDGAPPETIPASAAHAIFFMLPAGEAARPPVGTRLQITFRDGRQLAGASEDYRPDGPGFFLVPLDGRTRTARIWIYRGAVRRVTVD